MMTGLLGVRALVQTLLVIEMGGSGADQTLCLQVYRWRLNTFGV